ncbi:MAG: hypothetical protein R3C68_19515 [Myxococcota bacterium]
MADFDIDPSKRHRALWNEVARELDYPFTWSADGGTPHVIDGEDLTLTPAAARQFGIEAGSDSLSSPRLQQALRAVEQTLEGRRMRSLSLSVNSRPEVSTHPDVSHLESWEKEVVRRLSATVPILHKLDVLLTDPRGPKFEKQLQDSGDNVGAEQFARLSDVRCSDSLSMIADAEPKYCSALNTFPNERPRDGSQYPSAIAPTDITEEEKNALAEAWHGKAQYNPFLASSSVLTRDSQAESGWRWSPITRDPRYQKDLQELADLIIYAAQTPGIEPQLQAQLLTSATSLVSEDVFADHGAGAAWVFQSLGNLELSIGLGGGYSPMNKVHSAGLFLAVERKGQADALKQAMVPLLPDLEKRFADLINEGAPETVYAARPIDQNSVVRVVDAIATTQGRPYETLAFVGPGEGPVDDERGLAKRIMIANHVEAKGEKILLPLAKVALLPEDAKLVSVEHFLQITTAHEMAHPIGPRGTASVANGMRASDSVGSGLYSSIEESKSNVAALVALEEMQSRGVGGIDAAYVTAAYATYMAGVLRQMRFGGKAHGGGAAAEVGFFFQEKALKIVEVTIDGKRQNRVGIDYDALKKAVLKLWVTIGRIQATGDRAGAEHLLKEVPKTIPDGLEGILNRVNAAGIPIDVTMKYPELETLFEENASPH